MWNIHYKKNTKTAAHNVRKKIGVGGYAKLAKTPYDFWNLFFTNEIIVKIITYTNK